MTCLTNNVKAPRLVKQPLELAVCHGDRSLEHAKHTGKQVIPGNPAMVVCLSAETGECKQETPGHLACWLYAQGARVHWHTELYLCSDTGCVCEGQVVEIGWLLSPTCSSMAAALPEDIWSLIILYVCCADIILPSRGCRRNSKTQHIACCWPCCQ